LVAGEALLPEIRDRFFARYDGTELHNIYGPTEGTVYATHWACRRGDASRTVPIGKPITGTTAYVLDESGRPAPVGSRGELHLGGAGVARGYWRRPELTAEKFISDPFSSDRSARLFRTGDIASYRADGELEFFGRLDDQVKIRGNRIELGEIESTLLTHPAVKEAAAAVAEGRTSLVAYVVRGETRTETAELRAFLARKLPPFMIPAAIHFVDELPRTANGKLDRSALHAPPRWRAPDRAETALERELLEIWGDLLGKPIRLDDDFFESGGDSLNAVDLSVRVEERLGYAMSPSVLVRAPTVRQLAVAIQGEVQSPSACLVALRPEGTGLPIFLVHSRNGSLLVYRSLIENLAVDRPIYGLQRVTLDAEKHRLIGLEELAAYYVEELRRVQPAGPYYLGGGSFGGTVAFEMARMLEAAGERIGLVMLFDAGLGLAALSAANRLTRPVITSVKKLRFHARALGALDRRERNEYLLARLRGITDRAKGAWWRLRVRRHEKTGILPAELRDQLAEQLVAIHAYVPASKLNGRVVLYRADEQADFWAVGNDPAFGWRPYAPNLDVVHVTAAAHGEIVQVPHVTEVAADLRQRLEG
jgi:thioesterase domain-containing protein/acyl carrier protein